MLYQRSRTDKEDNYFAIYSGPVLLQSTADQFTTWETLLQTLDAVSLETFFRKTAGRVAARANPDRGWSQLVEAMNEVRGYQYAQSLGYTTCRLLDERGHPFPDIEALGASGECLIEVKTVQESEEELAMRGEVQAAEHGLPKRLKRVVRNKYLHAIKQIAGHPSAASARKICYLVITLDLRTVLAQENESLLRSFVQELQEEVEIYYKSQYWPAKK
jgi:hypothetical protein